MIQPLALRRYETSKYGTFGFLTDSAGTVLVPHTLEPNPVDIPDGTYDCIRYASPHFGYDVFVVTNVPGHQYIELHIGNTLADTHGCILFALTRTDTGLGPDSRDAFKAFMDLLKTVSSFTLVVTSNG